MGTWHLAVDFGTSNTAAAYTRDGDGNNGISTVRLGTRGNLMPSAVYAAEEATQLTVGDAALSAAVNDPLGLVSSPKRLIAHPSVNIRGHKYPTDEVIGTVFRTVVDKASALYGGQRPESLTVTYPEAWDQYAIDQLARGVQRAGVAGHDIFTLSEPRAAAVHYARRGNIAPGGPVGVFDFGGGTLDVAVLKAQDDGDFTVVATRGDNSLGGRTVDSLLYRWLIERIEHDDPDLADTLSGGEPTVMHAVQTSIQRAKEMLSETSSATIEVSTPRGETSVLITRTEFNELIHPVCSRARELMAAALAEAGAAPHTTPIFMTGGSSRIPHMQNELARVGQVMTLDDPKTVVSRGALLATTLGLTSRFAPAPVSAVAPETKREPAVETRVTTTTASETSGSTGKKWLIPAAAVAAVAVAAVGGLAIFGGGGGTKGGESTDTVASPTSTISYGGTPTIAPATGTTTAATSGDNGTFSTDDPSHLVNLVDGIEETVPYEFLNRIATCQLTDEVAGEMSRPMQGAPEPARRCSTKITERPEGADQEFYTFPRFVTTGADARANYDHISNDPAVERNEVIRVGRRERPDSVKLTYADGDSWMVWYPNEEILITADMPEGAQAWQLEKMLENEGFI